MLATTVEDDPMAPLFNSYYNRGCRGEGATPFPGLLQFILDMYLIMLSDKQRRYLVPFLSLSCDSTWD